MKVEKLFLENTFKYKSVQLNDKGLLTASCPQGKMLITFRHETANGEWKVDAYITKDKCLFLPDKYSHSHDVLVGLTGSLLRALCTLTGSLTFYYPVYS